MVVSHSMSPRNQKFLLVLCDILALAAGFGVGVLALILYSQYFEHENFVKWWKTTGLAHGLVHVFFGLLAIFRLQLKGLYSRRLPFWDELRSILGTLLYVAMTMGVVVLLAKWPFSRVLWLFSWLTSLFFIPIFRAALRRTLLRLGHWEIPVVMIGAGETALQAWKAFRSEPQLGFRVQKVFRLRDLEGPSIMPAEFAVEDVTSLDVDKRIEERDFLVVALEPHERAQGQNLIEVLSLKKSELHIVPPLGGLSLFGLESNHFFSHEVLLLRSKNNLGRFHMVVMKRVFDIVVSSLLLVLLSPLLVYLAGRTRRSGPGVIFSQTREGRAGTVFRCHKFRTMVPNAEKILQDLLANDPVARREWEEKTKITNDPRITSVGNFLRKTSLDELPQLWNVLRGDMSLVGPRPILLHEVEKYGPRLKFYRMVRPGLTGLWQVSGRSDTDYQYRVHLDAWYVKNWSLWYDIAILFKTVSVVLKGSGAY